MKTELTEPVVSRFSDKEKVAIYEHVFHLTNIYRTGGSYDDMKKILDAIDMWSYAHRCGNGEYSDKEQQEIIDKATDRLKNF